MNILVTGGAGFIGSHIVDALLEKGHKVSVVDNLSTGSKDNLSPKATFYKRDITEDLSDIFNKEKPNIVYHLAAQMDVRKSVEDPLFDAKNNVFATLNILENMKRVGSKKIIFSSTGGAIYGDDVKIPTSENEREQPYSPYGIAKLSIEKYLYFYKKVHGIDFVALRYANVYGPRQNSKGEAGVIAIFIGKILNDDQPIINGSGEQTRDYVFVKDVVKANVLALENKMSGIFNIGTSVETNVIQIFNGIVNTLGKNVKELHGPAKPGEQMRSCLSYEKINRGFGWKPEYKFENGLKETVKWFKDKK